MLWIVERIEGQTAICETEDGPLELPLDQLPAGTVPGSCLRVQDGVYFLDEEETNRRRKRNHAAAQALFRRRRANEPEQE